MRKSNREKIAEARRSKSATNIEIATFEDLLRVLCGGPLNPTQSEVLHLNTETPIGYMGRAGAAKTSTGCAGVWSRALFSPGSKWFVARKNYNDLKTTTMLRMQEMLNRLPPGVLLDRNKEPPETWWVKSTDPLTGEEGDPAQFMFIGLVDDLGSLEFHGGFNDEADEIEEEAKFNELLGRCRLKGYPRWVMSAFNGPPKTHWLYTACTGRDVKERKVREPTMLLVQPKFGENAQNLRDGYYEDLKKQYIGTPALLQRLVAGEWVATFDGLPVYPEFKEHIHVRKDLEFDPYSMLLRFWDFGYNHPVCLWAQIDAEGRLCILREENGERIEIGPFANRVKAMTKTFFPGVEQVLDFGDPAARQKKDTGSTLEHLAAQGITLRYVLAHIKPGLRAVRARFKMLIGDLPGLLIHDRCTVLKAAMGGGYRMKENNPEEPLKDDYYDHIADALRYGVTNLYGTLGDRPGYELPDSVAYQG